MAGFGQQVAAWTAQQERALDATVRQSVIELHQAIVGRVSQMGAVDTGAYRASFVYGAGSPSGALGAGGTAGSPSPPPGPPDVPTNAGAMAHYISNNQPYAGLVEYGTGSMSARPAVRQSVAEFPKIVAAAWQEAQKA